MNAKWTKRALLILLLCAIAGGFAWMLRPQPLLADFASVARGPMETTISEEGVNRVRDVFVVSAPVAGRLSRTNLRSGDDVEAGLTIVASIWPAEPPILDQRTRLELERAVESARAARDLAEAEVRRTTSTLEFARVDLERNLALSHKGVVSEAALQKAQLAMDSAREGLASATAQFDLRQHDLEAAQARLMPASLVGAEVKQKDCCVTVTAPVRGTVLRVLQESEAVVAAGTPLLEIGNTAKPEVAVDLLSEDAVLLQKGAEARIAGWGGAALKAHVREIEPTAFTKVSALGIEEQRVKVLLDYDDKTSLPDSLGHHYRVEATIVTWSAPDVLQVPVSALLRKGSDWAVFAVDGDRARLKTVKIGALNGESAEVLAGLDEGLRVVLHPSELLVDGGLVQERPGGG